MPILRWVGPFLALALGIGGGGLVIGIVRAVWAGGRLARVVGAAALGMGLVCGGLWLFGRSAAKDASSACRDASGASSRRYREERLPVCEEQLGTIGFSIARIFNDVMDAEENHAVALADRARLAQGLCPKRLPDDLECRCGTDVYPYVLRCIITTCETVDGVEKLRCL